MLKSFAGKDKITHETPWREAQELIDEMATTEEKRLRDIVEDIDQKHAYEDLIVELQEAWREQKRLERVSKWLLIYR